MSDDKGEDADYQLAVRLHKDLNGDDETKRSQANDEDADLQYARQLQAQLIDSDMDSSLQFVYQEEEPHDSFQQPKPPPPRKRKQDSNKEAVLTPANDYLNQTQNLVHPEWELVDPNPDVYSMFYRFDEKFFQKKLGAVVLEWSKRMYSCAGICYQRSNHYVKEVTIRLSEPLLKLRPRKDLVETLLHEMIHAYFFILQVHEGNGGHGPNFKAKMNMINKVAGTNITVYHSFHDEVDAYRTHIWRCTGICQNHTPFKGWVKRTSNRAPGPSDQWWAKHQRECGGTFQKVSEPSKPPKAPKERKPPKDITNFGKKSKKAVPAETDPKSDIRGWFKKPPTKKPATDNAVLVPAMPSRSEQDRPSATSSIGNWGSMGTPKSKPIGGPNIRSFADLTRDSGDDDEPPAKKNREKFPSFKETEQGYTLPKTSNGVARNIREIRERRFGQKQTEPSIEIKESSANDAELWESYDEDVMIRETPNVVIDLVDDESNSDEDQPPKSKPNSSKGKEIALPNAGEGDVNKKRRRNSSDSEIQHWESIEEVPVILHSDTDDDDDDDEEPPSRRLPMTSLERSQNVKREVLADESNLFYEDNIIFIDDEYNDDEQDKGNDPAINPMGTAGHSSLLMEFRDHNDVVPSCSNHVNDEQNDIVTCPICFDQLRRSELSNHLDGCSITLHVKPPSFKNAGWAKKEKTSPRGRKRKSVSSKKETLRSLGYTESVIAGLDLSSSSDSSSMPASEDELTPRQRRQRSLFKQTNGCPKCGQELMGHQLEAHRRICPNKKRQ